MDENTIEISERGRELQPDAFDSLPPGLLGGREFILDKVAKKEIESFLINLPKNAKILDAGAGAGVEAAIMESRGMKVVPLDLSRKMLAKIKKHAKLMKVEGHIGRRVQADILQLPFTEGTFDAVVCKDVFSMGCWADRVDISSELMRVLKNEGRVLIMAEEAPDTIIFVDGLVRQGKERELLDNLQEGEEIDLIRQIEFTEEYITRVLSSVGFQNINTKTEKKEVKKWLSDRLVSATAQKP